MIFPRLCSKIVKAQSQAWMDCGPGQGGKGCRESKPVSAGEQTDTLEAVMGLRHVCPPCVKLQETSMVSDEQPRLGSTQ